MAAKPMRMSGYSWSLDVFAIFAIKLKGSLTGFRKHFDQAQPAGAAGETDGSSGIG
jgi:hypothetical protein